MTKITLEGRYELSLTEEHLLGRGGMGNVYRGIDLQTGEPVAVKFLRSAAAQQPSVLRRFQQEAEALRKLEHPNIVKLFSFGETDDSHYLVMEYIDGGSLEEWLQRPTLPPVHDVVRIMLDLSDALIRAHRLNILHRDIKPSNVLLAQDKTPHLLDFGMALMDRQHITEEGMIVGTMAYMSPEVLQGEEVDARADIWSFGVMLYRLLTGKHPFAEGNTSNMIAAILYKPVTYIETLRPDLPTDLIDLIYQMLEKDLHARIPSMRLVGARLERLLHHQADEMQKIVSPVSETRFATRLLTPPSDMVSEVRLRVRHNLPAQPTAFLGRRQELREVHQLLQSPAVRLISIVGAGGIGKTRLALEAAVRALDIFPDGVYFLPLADLSSIDRIYQSLGEQIGYSFDASNSPQEDVQHYLREKHMLLVLDNFEHLAKQAEFVAELIRQAPHLKLLVTSREPLRLQGEHVLHVEEMALPRLNAPLDEVQGVESVRLFLQSARRSAPDFELSRENVNAVTGIIHFVQGLPLGIELAAAWVGLLAPAEILQEIQRDIDFLETDLHDRPERHRSLRAVFRYSWNLLSQAEKEVFAQLAVFRGGFERQAAQQVTGASLRNLVELNRKSLLTREPSGRYFISGLLRQYAEQKFAEHPTAEDSRRQHASYYLDFLRRQEPALNSRHQQDAISAISQEIDNVRLAWRWAVEHQAWTLLDESLHAMTLFHEGRSLIQEGARLLDEAARALEHEAAWEASYWRIRLRQAHLLVTLGDRETTVPYARLALEVFRTEDDPIESSYALVTLAQLNLLLGRYEETIKLAQEALSLRQHDKSSTIWLQAQGVLGYVEYLRGDFRAAEAAHKQLLEAAADSNAPLTLKAVLMMRIGEVYRETGQVNAAQQLFRDAYRIFRDARQRRGMASALHNLGGIHYLLGQYEDAQRAYRSAHRIYQMIGDRIGSSHTLSALADVRVFFDDDRTAESYYQQALQLRQEVGDKRAIGDSLYDLGRLALARGDHAQASSYFNNAQSIYEKLENTYGQTATLQGLGVAALLNHNVIQARHYAQQMRQLATQHGYSFLTALAANLQAEIALRLGDYDQARSMLQEALRLGKTAGSVLNIHGAVIGLAYWKVKMGDSERASRLVHAITVQPQNYALYMPYTRQRLLEIEQELDEQYADETQPLPKKRKTLEIEVDEILSEL